MLPGQKWESEHDKLDSEAPYKQSIAALIYVFTRTKTDFSFPDSFFARFQEHRDAGMARIWNTLWDIRKQQFILCWNMKSVAEMNTMMLAWWCRQFMIRTGLQVIQTGNQHVKCRFSLENL